MVSGTDQTRTLARRPSQRDGYRLEELHGELLVYHPAKTKVVYCNETAALVWHLCDGHRTIGDIVDLLSQAFPTSAGRMMDDVATAIEQLCSSDALTC